ncbi:hypothetical protein UCRPA7_6145 [Phaeoacremonium minimum UCRPA7]|uniref:U6 snRNA phosphodiesterase n=1 Tax=Phaeoacremonium minimum (strain UCR-PA7) TaxID=1286976 RepID=R8BG91_PHAM7|nr:hypothetical protein UCRPA7_6145 [Phaeoacremonium minimum UCRPA7]EON98320.1 hypothetical protein UCRPA7_6145 [Phaeoacremonium minimum UCRPA7]
MGLVDYSSSDSEAEPPAEAPAAEPPSRKRRTTGRTTTAPDAAVPGPDTASSALPPLPSAFHDLYASTVRPSPVDDPSLHQGRRRQIPHVAGNWPSHIYVEWHPPAGAHALLHGLLSALGAELRSPSAESSSPIELSTFLTSDLGAPLPLHVSLSRPFVLRTDEKDAFLEQLGEAVRGSGVAPFELRAPALAWHRSPDSNRSFLVLRVRSSSSSGNRGGSRPDGQAPGPHNRELATLLERCNKLVASYGQPTLYQQKPGAEGGDGSGSATDAFHISIAWSFAEPTAELRDRTAAVFARDEFRDAIPEIPVSVNEIKVKIGNVVTNVTLKGYSKGGDKSGQRKSLFGV